MVAEQRQEEGSIQASPLEPIFNNIGVDKPDLAQIGVSLLDLTEYLTKDAIGPVPTQRLRKAWQEQTDHGKNPQGARTPPVQLFQQSIEQVARLKEPDDLYVFVVPVGGGTVRLGFSVDHDRKLKVSLMEYAGVEVVRQKFEQLIGANQ